MDQKEHKEETFQAVIDGTENIKPKKKKEEKKSCCCSCSCEAQEPVENTNSCYGEAVEGICCIKVLG